MARFKSGDSKAFKSLFDTYWERLYAYAYAIYRDESICEDIVQDVFINLWERNQEAEIINIEGYLFRAVKNRISNSLRNLKFDAEIDAVLESIHLTESPDHSLEASETELYIDELLEQLPPKCQTVFRLSRIELKDNATIARELNISIRTVETQISKALRFLRQHFPKHVLPILIHCLLN